MSSFLSMSINPKALMRCGRYFITIWSRSSLKLFRSWTQKSITKIMFNPFKRKRKLMVTVEIEDRSKDKEAVFVNYPAINGEACHYPVRRDLWLIDSSQC